MNTYFFTHIYESEEVLAECTATDLAQAKKRLSLALDGAKIHYQGWSAGTNPQIDLGEISHRDDPICKEYPVKEAPSLRQEEDEKPLLPLSLIPYCPAKRAV